MNDEFRPDPQSPNGNGNTPLPPPAEPAETKASAEGNPPKKTSKKPPSKKGKKGDSDRVSASTAQAEFKQRERSQGTKEKVRNADSADKNGSSKKSKKEKVDLKVNRSERPAHKVIPYILVGIAAFVAVCLLLNLFCNFDNKCANDPSAHLMGSVGYWICYGLFGAFGPAVFALPFFILNMAFFWKSYIDNKLVLEKTVISLILLIFIGTTVHVFGLTVVPEEFRALSASDLILNGVCIRGGGLIGGGLGYFLVRYLNIVGGIIVSLFLTLLAAFFFLGMTPQHLLEHIRTRRNLRASERLPIGVDEEAPIKEQMKRRHERAAKSKSGEADQSDDPSRPPEGAVQYEDEPTPKKNKSRSNDRAMPILDASDDTPEDSPLYLPEDVTREEEAKEKAAAEARAKMEAEARARVEAELKAKAEAQRAEAERADAIRAEERRTNAAPVTAPVPKGAPAPARRPVPDAEGISARPARQPAPNQRPAGQAPMGQRPPQQPTANVPIRPVSPSARAQQPDAMDPVFPRSGVEAKTIKKIQKSDRDFELGSIFINLDDHTGPEPRRHAPIPPEVPMPGSTPRAAGTPAGNPTPAPKPAGQTPTNQSPAPNAPTRQATGQQPTRPAPNGAAGKPVGQSPAQKPTGQAPNAPKGAQKPIFRQAAPEEKTEYGLTNEEFERREAAGQAMAGAIAAKKNPTTKTDGKPAPKSTTNDGAKPAPKEGAKPSDGKENPAEEAVKPYVFPPISYLHPGEPMTAENQAEINENMEKLSATLANFNVRIKEITYSCGPTVTRYEIFPDAGVRVRTITNLADDIALSFAVQGVRMEAIAGKSAIGVEVPNTTRCNIYLRDLLESSKFTENPSRLTAGLGADVTGTPLLFDIAKMPHLLVAGTTGSGKSICINCIIMSILFKARPDEVKLILIDPKKVEFSLYKGLPHLMAPIIVTPKDAAGALQAAVEEMENRFTKIQDVGVHDIAGYNKQAAKDPDLAPMSHVVIIIDELADLMMTARDEVEDSICRLAQKARAAGMHIIVGTQRPSVDVVTGLIKSNIPSRIACTVRSQVDSRTILDFAGAEKLLGRGDMLFAPIGAMKPTRVQGAFVSDSEVEKICEFIRATNGTAKYDENFTSKMKEFSAQCGNKKGGKAENDLALPTGEGGDNKYVDAIRIAIEENRVSTSLLQRKLGIGYSRAAKIIDRMEEEGLVSKQDGSKARSILISAEQFIERYVEGDEGASGEDV